MFVRRFGGWLALAVVAAAVAVGLCGWLAAASASPGAPMALITDTLPVTDTSSSPPITDTSTAPTTKPVSSPPKSSTTKKSSTAPTSSAPRTSTRASSTTSFFEPPPDDFSFFPPETDPVTSVHRVVIRTDSHGVDAILISGTTEASTPSTCVSQLVLSQTLPLGSPCRGVTQHIVAEDNTKNVAPIAFSVLAAGAGILLRMSSRGVRAARHR